MSKMQTLSVFLTERLTLAAQEIFKAVEDVFAEYNEELCRSRQEIELLKRRLQQAGVHFESESHPCSSQTQEQKQTQTFFEEWRAGHDQDTEMHMKLEVYTQQQKNEVQMPACNESTPVMPNMDIYHDQMPVKDTDTQLMDSSENNFPFINQIKNEPEINDESCEEQQYITGNTSDDSGTSDASSDVNKIRVSHITSLRHKTQTFTRQLRSPEMLMQHRMEVAQMRERLADEERKKAAAKARSQKHKQKVYGNPELREAYRRKERESILIRGVILPDVALNKVSVEVEKKLYLDSAGADGLPRADRFAACLFKRLIPLELYQEWTGSVNFDGSRGKNALPSNLWQTISEAVTRQFHPSPSDWKQIRNRINQLLRKKRLNFPHF